MADVIGVGVDTTGSSPLPVDQQNVPLGLHDKFKDHLAALGQTLHTTRVDIYLALIEGMAFGARMIIERIREYGVPIDRVVCCGGVADDRLYRLYRQLHDAFGGVNKSADLSDLMKELIRIREERS